MCAIDKSRFSMADFGKVEVSPKLELKGLMPPQEVEVAEAIHDIVPYGSVMAVFGVGEADTTAFMVNLVASLGCGTEWHGYPINGEHSTLQCVRDPWGLVRRRFEALERIYKCVIPDGNLIVEQPVSLSAAADVEALLEAIHCTERARVDVVAFDLPKPASGTKRNGSGADYNALITGAVDLLGACYDCDIVILHEPASVRAHSSGQAHWSDDPRVDVAISVRCNQRGKHYWRLEKPRSKTPLNHAFDLVGVNLGPKAGLPETFFVARKSEGDPLARDPKDPPKGQLDAALSVLKSLEAGNSRAGQGCATTGSQGGISGRDLLSECRRRATRGEGGLAAGHVKSALRALIRTGRVLEREGRLFMAADTLTGRS